MRQRSLCPVLIGRDAELSSLEDALLAANRGEQRFVLLEGEAGMGKTRLTDELIRRAERIGNEVIAGGCTQAEVGLPYLPFIEALGNFIMRNDPAALRSRLGAAARDLGQLFPVLADDAAGTGERDPTQAKLRLFEAIVALLAAPANDKGVLVVLEDAHWMDPSSRELLDHLVRRTSGMRIMILLTIRPDEIDRRHPMLPFLQGWRRGGADRIRLTPLADDALATMIATILDDPAIDQNLVDLLRQRAEGNPFVIEEMLKEALDRGEGAAVQAVGIPETVRDAILLRLSRLDPDANDALHAGAVLGRRFDYATLVAVSGIDEQTVHTAIRDAVEQQLLEADPVDPSAFRWRHALTQEAIYDDIIVPRRQSLHSRAADVLSTRENVPRADVAYHLLGAARFAEAVPICIEAADEALEQIAYRQAAELLERIAPHVTEPHARADLIVRLGRAWWMTGESATAQAYLTEGIEALEQLGRGNELARPLVMRGRTFWEQNRSPEARADYERALALIEPRGASADLAFVLMRIAGLHAFELRFGECLAAAERAAAVAEEAGAEVERVWAQIFVAFGTIGLGNIDDGVALARSVFDEAFSKGHIYVASNCAFNLCWTHVHMMLPELDDILAKVDRMPDVLPFSGMLMLVSAYIWKVQGKLADSLRAAHECVLALHQLGFSKFAWRAMLLEAEGLAEQGRAAEGREKLPADVPNNERQDRAVQLATLMRMGLIEGKAAEGVELAREVAGFVDTLATHRETVALAVQTLTAAGELAEARALLGRCAERSFEAGKGFLDLAEAHLLLAEGRPADAAASAVSAIAAARHAGFVMVEQRAHIAHAAATAASGDPDAARGELEAVIARASELNAVAVIAEALAAASTAGLEIAAPEAAIGRVEQTVPVGERLITSLFADVRNYTGLTASTPPPQMGERIATLYRWATTEVERNDGVVNKFAGDAVMATFNLAGTSLDHVVQALRAALALRDKAALTGLPVGIGIACGPAVVGHVVEGLDMMVTGVATNLAARLQTAAEEGEILLSDEAYRRAEAWLTERGLAAEPETLTLKGFDQPQIAYRIPATQAARA